MNSKESVNSQADNDVFDGYGIRIKLSDPEKFLIVAETLTRIGMSSKTEDGNLRLSQTCHLLHKRGQYAILHFKELYELDGRDSTIDKRDLKRRDLIAKLLESWGLVELVDEVEVDSGRSVMPKLRLRVLKHSEVADWELKPMYHLGKNKSQPGVA